LRNLIPSGTANPPVQFFKPLDFKGFAFPDHEDRPLASLQDGGDLTITLHVTFELSLPKVCI